MNLPPASEHPVNVALRRAHRSILLVLAACAAVIAFGASGESAAPSDDPPRSYVYAATALAVASIMTRRRQVATHAATARLHVVLSLASLVFAAGVGLVGVAASVEGTSRNSALLFALAGAIFALRPPPPVLPPTSLAARSDTTVDPPGSE
jgi:uncharacterized membrane protein